MEKGEVIDIYDLGKQSLKAVIGGGGDVLTNVDNAVIGDFPTRLKPENVKGSSLFGAEV